MTYALILFLHKRLEENRDRTVLPSVRAEGLQVSFILRVKFQ